MVRTRDTFHSPTMKGQIVFSLTSAPRSAVTHIDNDGWTVCGRQIGEKWSGQFGTAPEGIPTCQQCQRGAGGQLSQEQEVTRRYVPNRDTYELVQGSTALGTIDPTRDRTGDVRAIRANGEIVAPRFSDHSDAEAYLMGGDRPILCLGTFGGLGACIRERGHYGVCVDAMGHRFDPAVGWVGHGACECAALPRVHRQHCSVCSAPEGQCVCKEIAPLSWEERGKADAGIPIDDDAATDEDDDVTEWRNLRGHLVATARRYVRDARALRGYDRDAVLLALRNARQYRQAAASAFRSLALVESGEDAW